MQRFSKLPRAGEIQHRFGKKRTRQRTAVDGLATTASRHGSGNTFFDADDIKYLAQSAQSGRKGAACLLLKNKRQLLGDLLPIGSQEGQALLRGDRAWYNPQVGVCVGKLFHTSLSATSANYSYNSKPADF